MYLGSFEVNVSEPILFTNIIILAMPHPTYEMEIPKPRKYAGKHTTCPAKVKIQSLFSTNYWKCPEYPSLPFRVSTIVFDRLRRYAQPQQQVGQECDHVGHTASFAYRQP